ncbi:hypothetical protein A9Q99_02260 [Gammaproteobacteria bacterium 45_16_T64]|nr:hypothetical protein A9Q99_02260 [Gammaproteobacteria bacterium 45_16_T64]
MNSGKSLTFYGLFDEVDYIEIPILQRDYAQGRIEESEVRTLFLRSLFDALTVEGSGSRQPLDLDFVYGNYEDTENKTFSVLDGQQRLTTLFLLHWLLAVENGRFADFREQFITSDGRSRFTYKTRPSTTEFFNALTAKDFVMSKTKISEQIRDSQWFYLSWKQDPTVQACLCMLDAIQQMFAGRMEGLFEKLTNTTKPYITFQFLNLHSFGLSDELYIKMNARGKPLTVFENFKAKFEKVIQSIKQPLPDYKLDFSERSVNGYDYFIHKIDTDWADLFWPYRNVFSGDNTFDDEIMNFFRLIIAYQYLLDNQDSPIVLARAKSDIFGFSGSLRSLTLSKYEELNCFNKNLIVRLIEVLDFIYCEGLVDNKIKPYLVDQYYYAEEKTFKKVLSNAASYDDKLRFYAFYTYLAKNKDHTDLSAWMRVIYNLIENTIINTSDEFYKALFAINELSQFDTSILATLKGDFEFSGFTGAQVLEEKIKAHLLLKSHEWNDVIVETEKHPFFDGQIGFILNFSGILAFYREHKHCDWGDEFDKQYLSDFRKYAYSAGEVFSLIRSSSSTINYLWERAVLSKGIYFTEKSGDKFNLLSTRDTRNNIPRDHSWRRLLRIGSSVIEQKQAFIKAVIDDISFDSENIASSLGLICEAALSSPKIGGWRQALIKHKELIDYCNQGFITRNNQEVILLSESRRNHYHSELYTKVLELELKSKKALLEPFSFIGYEPVKSRDDTAYTSISGWTFGGQRYSIEVRKQAAGFNIRFKGGIPSNYDEKLMAVLDTQGFVRVESGVRDTGIHGHFAQNEQCEVKEVISKLVSLCSDIKELNDE